MADITIHTSEPGDSPEAIQAAERAASEAAHEVAHNAVQQHIGGAVEDTHNAALHAMDAANQAAEHAEKSTESGKDDTSALILAGFGQMNESLKQLLDLQKASKDEQKTEDDALESVNTDNPISGELDNGGPDVPGATTNGTKGDPGSDTDPGEEEETEKDNAKKAKKVAAKDVQPKRRAGWRQKLLGSSGGLK